jgi:predicted RNA-binding Zn-ribbon protein involved in translation (DUF1610 family)
MNRFEERKSKGMCTRCGAHPALGRINLCLSCQHYMAKYQRRKYMEATLKHVCPRCGRKLKD